MRLLVLATLFVGIEGGMKKNSDIVFFFGSSFMDNQTYPLDDASDVLDHPRFCHEKPTMLYIHGWNSNAEGRDAKGVVGAYLPRADHNIMALDWGDLAIGEYITFAVPNAERFGLILADALLEMTTNGFDLSSLHLVTHSLGSQLAGYTGREIQRKSKLKLPRITALDPAKPLFYPSIGTEHICAHDADLVDVIHSNAGLAGAPVSTGTIDFWPSGGHKQPACPEDELTFSDIGCSHGMSWRYYAESVMFPSSTFLARKCDSWDNYTSGDCDSNQQASMGINEMKGMRGRFYLHVNSMAWFSRTEENELDHGQYINDMAYNWWWFKEDESQQDKKKEEKAHLKEEKKQKKARLKEEKRQWKKEKKQQKRQQKRKTLLGHVISKNVEVMRDVKNHVKNVRQVLPLAVVKRVLSKN